MNEQNPWTVFCKWFTDAQQCQQVRFAGAACLATVDKNGMPEARMVAIRHFDEKGLVFYTDKRSPKVTAITTKPNVALALYWEPLQKQIRIQATTEVFANAQTIKSFHAKARNGQIAEWCSEQSSIIDRSVLQDRFTQYQQEFADQEIPCPEFWVGVRIIPTTFEFWQQSQDCLHQRCLYSYIGDKWSYTTLAP